MSPVRTESSPLLMNSVCANCASPWLSFLAFAEFAALLHQLGDNARPSGLMAGAQASAGVAMEVLVKENQVSPMRVRLELLQVAEYRSVALFVTKKDDCHSARQLPCPYPQRLHVSRSSRELDFEIVTDIVVEFLQGLDQQKIHRKPDGATPVRIASEDSGQRFARLIVHSVLGSVDVEYVRMFPMELGQRADPVR